MSIATAQQTVRLFQALAHETRLHILSLLARHGDTLTVEQVVERLHGPFDGVDKQPGVSHHLKILYDAGFIARRKDHLHAYYSINPAMFQQAHEILDTYARRAEEALL